MRVLVFGASGATGYHAVSQGLANGHYMTAFVRDPSKLEIDHRHLDIFTGDVSDMRTVEDAVQDQDAVVSALGASNPFTRNVTLIRGVSNIVTAMAKLNVRRFIYQSFLGVKEYRSDLGFLMNSVVPLFLASVIKDHEQKEKVIVNSGLDWTIVRCAMLTNGPLTKKYKAGERIDFEAAVPLISRANVADFMVRQLHDVTHMHKKPRILQR